MWNSYWSGRSRRDVPQVNYNESSEDDEYDSPLVSPVRPPPTRAGSPALLAVPTLSDNVDEELAAVTQTLRNVGHTHTFRGTRPEPEGEAVVNEVAEEVVSAEEVVEGLVFQGAENLKLGAEGDGDEGDADSLMATETC